MAVEYCKSMHQTSVTIPHAILTNKNIAIIEKGIAVSTVITAILQ